MHMDEPVDSYNFPDKGHKYSVKKDMPTTPYGPFQKTPCYHPDKTVDEMRMGDGYAQSLYQMGDNVRELERILGLRRTQHLPFEVASPLLTGKLNGSVKAMPSKPASEMHSSQAASILKTAPTEQ